MRCALLTGLVITGLLQGGLADEPVSPPPVSSDEAAAPAPVEKPAREPIYNPEADARADIAAAVAKAKRNNQRVLIKWGGNWCGWCYLLHDVFHHDAEVVPLIRSEYVLVLVDALNNQELLLSYGQDNDQHGYPFLTVLDAEGNVLTNQNTADLEDGPKHDVAKVKEFLEKWKAEPLDAEETLAAAIHRSNEEDKKTFVHFGAPWCGWCHRLDDFLHENTELLERDFVVVKLDTDRMTNGQQVLERLREEESVGIPWMIILGQDGESLVTSDAEAGNIGFPVNDEEIAHFIAMLEATKSRLSGEEIGVLKAALESSPARQSLAVTPPAEPE